MLQVKQALINGNYQDPNGHGGLMKNGTLTIETSNIRPPMQHWNLSHVNAIKQVHIC